MNVNDMIASAISQMAMVGDDEEKRKLKADAKAHTLSDWNNGFKAKVGGVGFLTGIPGGMVGVATEAFDLTYLLASCGRACYGVGHIKGREVNYDLDMTLILAIWAGAAEATVLGGAGKFGIKIGGKVAPKLAEKVGAKLMGKVMPKVAAKLAAKLVMRLPAKAIPLVGGLVSSGVNVWVADGLTKAAAAYYSGNYVIPTADLRDAFEDAVYLLEED